MVSGAETESRELEKRVEIGKLCAFYGSLLTSRQLEAVELHYLEDLSLAEIAAQQDTTRQNIHEAITRSVRKLQDYEARLGLVRKAMDHLRQLRGVQTLCEAGRAEEAAALIRQIIQNQEGEDTGNGI